jgi:hypothetical protein
MRRLLFSTSAQSRQPLLADPIEQWRIPGQSGPEPRVGAAFSQISSVQQSL